MPLSLFLARHFRKGTSSRSASAPAVRVATISIAIGLAVMLITEAVVSGFKKEVSGKVEGMASHVEIMDVRSLASPESYAIDATPSFISEIKKTPDVRHVQCIASKMGILKTEDNFLAIQLKGIGPDYDSTFIHSCITKGHMPADNEILLSRRQADDLELSVGDRVFSYYFEDEIHTRRFTISGIYDTHMSLFDRNVVFSTFSTVAGLNPWGEERQHACNCIEVHLSELDCIPNVQDRLQSLTAKYTGSDAKAISVKEHYPQIFSWVDLLDFNMLIILILMLCVAGITMISGLLILILERTQTIGILKALGATNRQVRHAFLHFAAMITLRGMLWGNLIALAALFAQQKWGLIHLNPDTYYVDAVPVLIRITPILLINAGTLILTILALILPSLIILRIQPAKAIRFE